MHKLRSSTAPQVGPCSAAPKARNVQARRLCRASSKPAEERCSGSSTSRDGQAPAGVESRGKEPRTNHAPGGRLLVRRASSSSSRASRCSERPPLKRILARPSRSAACTIAARRSGRRGACTAERERDRGARPARAGPSSSNHARAPGALRRDRGGAAGAMTDEQRRGHDELLGHPRRTDTRLRPPPPAPGAAADATDRAACRRLAAAVLPRPIPAAVSNLRNGGATPWPGCTLGRCGNR